MLELRNRNYYERLNVPRNATKRQIRLAYRELANVYHPDAQASLGGTRSGITGAHHEIFKLLTEAYATLSNEIARDDYDRKLATARRNDLRYQKTTAQESPQQGYQQVRVKYSDEHQSHKSKGSLAALTALMRDFNFHTLALFFFPIAVVPFVCLYAFDRDFFIWAVAEDGLVNWITVLCWALGSFVAALCVRRRGPKRRLFFVGLCLFCAFVALEELNWGQRFIGFDTPTFVSEQVGHREMSVHYILTGLTGIPVQKVAGGLLLVYGLLIPFVLCIRRDWRRRVRSWPIVFPQRIFIPGFSLAVLLMIAPLSGRGEELGELFFAACFLFFIIAQYRSILDMSLGQIAGERMVAPLYILCSFAVVWMNSQEEHHRRSVEAWGQAQKAFIQAVEEGDAQSASWFLKNGLSPEMKTRRGIPLLIVATQGGHGDAVRNLLNRGANPNIRDGAQNTALSYAIRNDDAVNILNLVEAGVDVNAADGKGMRPLELAVEKHSLTLLKLLLERGADPNLVNSAGQTVLHAAVVSDSASFVDALLKHGADLTIVDSEGRTAADYATPKSSVSVFLKSQFAREY